MMSLVGKKRQFAWCKAMSGVGGKAAPPVEHPDFSVCPNSDVKEDGNLFIGALAMRRVTSSGRARHGNEQSLSSLLPNSVSWLRRRVAPVRQCC